MRIYIYYYLSDDIIYFLIIWLYDENNAFRILQFIRVLISNSSIDSSIGNKLKIKLVTRELNIPLILKEVSGYKYLKCLYILAFVKTFGNLTIILFIWHLQNLQLQKSRESLGIQNIALKCANLDDIYRNAIERLNTECNQEKIAVYDIIESSLG